MKPRHTISRYVLPPALAASLLLLCACGQPGKLYLPESYTKKPLPNQQQTTQTPTQPQPEKAADTNEKTDKKE